MSTLFDAETCHARSGGGGASSRAADMVVGEITENGELEHETKPLTFARLERQSGYCTTVWL